MPFTPQELEEIRQKQMARSQPPQAQPQPFPGAITFQAPDTVGRVGAQIPQIQTETALTGAKIPQTQAETAKIGAQIPQIQTETEHTKAETDKINAEIRKAELEKQNHDRAVHDALDYQRSTIKNLHDAQSHVGNLSTGWAGYLKDLPANPANSLKNALSPISSNTAFERLQNTRALSPTGGSATGQTSDFEQKMLMNSVAGIADQTQYPSDMMKHLNMVELHFYRSMAEGQGKELPTTLEEGRALFPELQPEFGADDKKLSTTEKTVSVPEGYQKAHGEFVAANQGKLTPEDYIAFRHKLDEEFLPARQASHLDPKEVQNYVDQVNAGQHHLKVPAINVPLSKAEQENAKIAETAFETGVPQALDALSFNAAHLAMTPEQEEANRLAREASPIATTVGDIAGSIAPIGAAEHGIMAVAKGLGKPIEAGIKTNIGANALYQGAREFNSAEPGEGLSAAAKGVALGGVSAAGGNLAAKGLTPFLSKSTQSAIDALEPTNPFAHFAKIFGKNPKGTDLTTIQRMGGGHAEEMFRSVPFSRSAQNKAVKSWNINEANNVLKDIPDDIVKASNGAVSKAVPKGVEAGNNSTAFLHDQLTNAYEVLKPKIVGSIDREFANKVVALGKSAPNKGMWAQVKDAIKPLSANKKAYSGQDYIDTQTELRALANDLSQKWEGGDTDARKMLKVVNSMRDQVKALVGRNTPEISSQLKAIEKGWSRKMLIQDATNRANKVGGVYSPGQKLDAIKFNDPTPNKGASAFGRALDQDKADAARKVMGAANVPERASAISTGLSLGGIGAGLGAGSVLAPALAKIAAGAGIGAYTPGIKRIVQGIISARRPDILKALLKNADPATEAAIRKYIGEQPGASAASAAFSNYELGRNP